ncbi:MAG: DivIVA domain-containing protein [Ilumatobacteraceae bacterium]
MAISFSRPDPSSPAAVSAAAFTVARRGYDQTEVRDFLRMVSAELARLQERERFLESELKAMQTRGMSGPGMLDEEVVTALLGEEAARVLGAAREASAQIRQRAEENATRLVKEAASDAARLREEAELEAVRRRDDAAADAEAEIELAKQQGREMVNEARDYREKVLSELARRRELARAQIEQLVANRDRLLNAFERARLATDDVMTGLVSVDDDLPREFVNLAPTTGPVSPVTLDAPIVQMFDREKDIHEEPVAPAHVAEFATGGPVIHDAVEDVEEVLNEVIGEIIEVESVEVVVESVVEVEIVETATDEEVVAGEVVVDELVAAEIVENVEQPEPSNVVSLFGKDRVRPEPTRVNPEHPSVDHSPVASVEEFVENIDEKPIEEVPAPPRDQVDDIFARLRASSVSKASEGSVVEVRKKADEAKSMPVVEPVRNDLAFERRAEALAPLVTKMSRNLKRVLADEENGVLEHLRQRKPVMELKAMCGTPAEHAAKYVDAVTTEVMAAAKAGATFVDADAKRMPTKTDINAAITETVKRLLVTPLRNKVSEVLAAHATDKEGAAKAIRGVYRQWKSTQIDEHIDDVACLAYSRGMYVTFAPGTQVCWMVDPNGPACADAEDNSLAGCVVLGKDFPTGHTEPLAHAGCRCLLTPLPN